MGFFGPKALKNYPNGQSTPVREGSTRMGEKTTILPCTSLWDNFLTTLLQYFVWFLLHLLGVNIYLQLLLPDFACDDRRTHLLGSLVLWYLCLAGPPGALKRHTRPRWVDPEYHRHICKMKNSTGETLTQRKTKRSKWWNRPLLYPHFLWVENQVNQLWTRIWAVTPS